MTPVLLIGYGLAVYAAVGIAVGVGFVAIGASRVLPGTPSFTPAARLLVLPGAAALWPYVLLRWLKARAPASNQA